MTREGSVSLSAGADNTPGKNRLSKVLFAVGSGDKCKHWDIFRELVWKISLYWSGYSRPCGTHFRREVKSRSQFALGHAQFYLEVLNIQYQKVIFEAKLNDLHNLHANYV